LRRGQYRQGPVVIRGEQSFGTSMGERNNIAAVNCWVCYRFDYGTLIVELIPLVVNGQENKQERGNSHDK
jgi:hypothetical protein